MTTSRRTLLLFSGAACATVAVLATVLRNGWVWDDAILLGTRTALDDPKGLWPLLTQPFWESTVYQFAWLPEYWRPVTNFSFWAVAQLAGRTPWAFHLHSLLWALAAAGSAAWFARTVWRASPWASALVVLAVAAHPLNAEVMCMAANVADSMVMTGFFLAAVWTHRFVREGGWYRAAGAGLAALVAMGAKELGIILVAIPLLLWLLSPTWPRWKEAAGRRIAVSAAVFAAALGTYIGLRAAVFDASAIDTRYTAPPQIRLPVEVMWFYGGQLLKQLLVAVPNGATLQIDTAGWSAHVWSVAAWGILLGWLGWDIAHTRRLSRTGVLLGAAVILGTPSLLGATVEPGHIEIPTRYLYAPLLLVAVAAVPAIERLLGSRFAAVTWPVVALWLLLTFVRIGEWRDNPLFFASELSYHPHSLRDLNNLVESYLQLGRYDKAEQAVASFARTNPALPKIGAAHLRYLESRVVYYAHKDMRRATLLAQEAVRGDPVVLDHHVQLARCRMGDRRPDQALLVLRKALGAPFFSEPQKDKLRQLIVETVTKWRQLAHSGLLPDAVPPTPPKDATTPLYQDAPAQVDHRDR